MTRGLRDTIQISGHGSSKISIPKYVGHKFCDTLLEEKWTERLNKVLKLDIIGALNIRIEIFHFINCF